MTIYRWTPIRPAIMAGNHQIWTEKKRARVTAERSLATPQHLVNKIADERYCASNGSCDRGCPISPLVPGEQVAGEAHAQGEQEQEHTGDPGELTWIFISAKVKRAQHMEEDDQHHEAGTPVMDAADQPAIADTGHDVLDAVVGMVGGGDVINGEHDAGDTLEDERGTGWRSPG